MSRLATTEFPRVEELIGRETVLDVAVIAVDLDLETFELVHPNAGEPWMDLPPGTSGCRGEA